MIQQRAALQQELIHRGVIADRGIIERRQQLEAGIRQRQSSQQSLAMTGLSMSGMGVAGGMGQGLAVGSALERAGHGRPGSIRGAGGLAIGAAQMSLEFQRKFERFNPNAINASPFLDPGTVARGRSSIARR
ncbi:MAG: hypothetical protein U0798_17585 [Gemmataceae bacterium]